MLSIFVPEWEPLLNFAPDHVGDFMWMFSVELKDGTRLQAYKQYWTRHYLHLASDGRAFVYLEKQRYEEVSADWLLARVTNQDLQSSRDSYIVRHNYGPEEIEVRWTRCATKHRIARERSRFVAEHCGLRFRQSIGWEDCLAREDRNLFLGDDEAGVALEVVAVELYEEAFLVIHAMPLRDQHRLMYEEAKRWRR